MGGSSKAPTGYQPTGQAQADQSYQNLTSSLTQGGQQLQSQVIPAYSGVTSAVQNNPYAASAQAGANQTAAIGSGYVAPSQLQGAASSQGLGNLATGLTGQVAGQNASGTGANILGSNTGQASTLANSGYLQDALALLGQSAGAGSAVLNAGFDPQQTLYNQQQQANLDQTNAINAMNGVSGSPYGAGLATQSNQNFNTNWENQQLNREATAASAYDGLINTGVGAYSGLLGSNTGAQSTLTGAGTNAYSGLTGAETSGISALGSLANNSYQGASGLNQAGLNTLSTASALPSGTYLTQQQSVLDALNAQTQGTNAALAPTQQAITDQGNYLSIGQNATALDQKAVAANNAQSNALGGALGSALGGAVNLLSNPLSIAGNTLW